MKLTILCLALLSCAGCYFPDVPISPAAEQRQRARRQWEERMYRQEKLDLERQRLELERQRLRDW